jgi:hypothetical protein
MHKRQHNQRHMADEITVAEFARRIGVTEPGIRRATSRTRLTASDFARVHQSGGLVFLNDHLSTADVASEECLSPTPRYAPPFGDLAQRHRKDRTELRNLLALHFERHGRGHNNVRAVTGDVVMQRLAQ